MSAGLLLFRRIVGGTVEVLLVHPGGPLWAARDEGVWSIPKGEAEQGEDLLSAAHREFVEELGRKPPATGTPIDLGEVTQSQAKRVHAWAIEAEIDVSTMQSNTFEMEWPPRSGRRQRFPEIDEAAWFDVETARKKLLRAQRAFIDRLERHLAGSQARPAHLGS